MDLLKDLNFNFVMIYIIHSVLLENHLNYLKDSIFECFLKEYNRLLFLKKKKIFFTKYNNKKSKS